jgi:gamma-glutamyl hercynylcysteine S-oxide synthase
MFRATTPEAHSLPSDRRVPAPALRRSLQARLLKARAESDGVFRMLAPQAMRERPIPERHRVLFYLGHIEAFDWNLIARSTLERDPFNAGFDSLFAFGIDPVDGGLPDDQPGDWPSIEKIEQYNRKVRSVIDEILRTVDFTETEDLANGLVFEVAIEHRLMHVETLTYMLHWLAPELKRPSSVQNEIRGRGPSGERILIPEGDAILGQPRGTAFGWDNEFNQIRKSIPEFDIDRDNVTNDEFLAFVREGGYEDRSLWNETDWEWKRSEGIEHPRFWEKDGERWMARNMFDRRPLEGNWPVYVSHAEAAAFARWKGRRLPTEAEWDRAAYGAPEGEERRHPWGGASPGPEHGNFGCRGWDPAPVGAFPSGDSAFGVADLVGNGWEWTSTPFGPLDGFERFSFYPGYSANFFDGKHYVMKGASARTARALTRRSFRNWFQPHYPKIYATFRTVSE